MQNIPTDPTADPQASSAAGLDATPSANAPGTPEVWGEIPSRNTNFTGREEILRQLRDDLTTAGFAAVVPPYAMHGLGGVGKTQIAIEYAYRYRRFYNVVWWIRSDQDSLIEASIAGLAPRLRLPYAGVDESAKAALDALRLGKPYEKWLLIFDAAEGPDSIRRFLVNGPGHTLITSRNPSWNNVAEMVQVEVFSRAESAQFLGRRVPGIQKDDSEALAEALGDLPLALDQAGALQVEAGIPVQDYLTLLQERTNEVLSQAQTGDYPVPVAAAWSVSVSTLRKTAPEAIELLTFCAFFGPGPIPREVLVAGRDVVSEPLRAILRDPIEFLKAIRSLTRSSLITFEATQRAIQVHRLVQAVTREDLSEQDRERVRHDVQLLLAKATPRDPDDSTTWPRFAELLPHYGPADMIACRDADARLSIRAVIRYHYMVGGFHAALELADRAQEQWSHDVNTPPTDLLALKRHRGMVLRALGKYHDAFEVNAAAMAEATKSLGSQDEETLLITNSHGGDMRAAGDFRAAYALDEDSVSRHISAFGEQDTRTLRAKNNFALDKAFMGDFKAARQLHSEVYQLQQEVYRRGNHPSVLSSLNNLTRAVRMCGEYAEAYFMAEDCYAACLNNLGPVHPTTLRAARDLVIAERLEVGGTEEAVQRATDILEQHRNRHGHSHPATLAAATALVNTWREARKLDDAISLAEEVANLAPEVYGPDHPFWYACRGNLALLLRLSGDAARARELHETSVNRLNVLLGADHHYTLTCAMGLASDLAATGDLSEAQSRGQDTLERLRNTLWPEHPITLACTINLALDLRATGQEIEATQLRSDALELYTHTLGNQHPATQAAFEGQRLDIDFDLPPV